MEISYSGEGAERKVVASVKTADGVKSQELGTVKSLNLGGEKTFIFTAASGEKQSFDSLAELEKHAIKKTARISLKPVRKGQVIEVMDGGVKVGELVRNKIGAGYLGVSEDGIYVQPFETLDEAVEFFNDMVGNSSVYAGIEKQANKPDHFEYCGIIIWPKNYAGMYSAIIDPSRLASTWTGSGSIAADTLSGMKALILEAIGK